MNPGRVTLFRLTPAILVWALTAHSHLLFGQAVTLQDNGSPASRVDIVIVGDGYGSGELGKFAADVDLFLSGIFQQDPLREYRSYFNVRRIDVASSESGVDHPERSPPVFKNTAFDATYNCGAIQRLICASTAKVLDAVSVLPPSQRDLIVLMVNDSEYGGAGGTVATTSTHIASVEIILHELGHTLAFLADEYTSQPPGCSDSAEPTEVNTTRETNRSAIKWGTWISPSTAIPTTGTAPGVPGLYLGSRYCPNTLYRPTYDSKMRSLGRPYEQINTEQLVRRFYAFARPVENQSPTSTTLTLTQGQIQPFSVTTPVPATHLLAVSWQLNGVNVGTGNTFSLTTAGLDSGTYILVATAADGTPMVRNDPGSLLQQQIIWTISLLPSTGGGLTVSLSAPTAGSTVSGSVVVSADASDSAGIAGVQFKVDGANVGTEDKTVPYAIVWNSTGVANGQHTLTAVARNTLGSLATSAEVMVVVNNLNSGGVMISAVRSTPGNSGTVRVTWTTDSPADSQVEFGTTTAYGQSAILPSLTTAHSVDVAGLSSNTTYHYRVKSRNASNSLGVSDDFTLLTFSFSNLGGLSRTTDGHGALVTGYGRLQPGALSTTPSGVAIFGYRQQGILVSEAGVPDSPQLTSGRTYAEVSVTGAVNTGLAFVNPNNLSVRIFFDLRDKSGNIFKSGIKDLGPNEHVASFLDGDPYFSGLGFQGTFSFTSTLPVSVIALRGFFNERTPSEFLMSTLPVIDLSLAAGTGTQVIPHFAAGGGSTTQILLVNTTGTPQTGTLEFRDAGSATGPASPKVVNIDGVNGSATSYLVAANGATKLVITGATPGLSSGSVRVIPTNDGPAPTPLVVFAYKPEAVTVSEATVPVTMGTAFRMYVELSPASLINSGIAIANATGTSGTVTLSVTKLDGSPVVIGESLPVAAFGQIVGFLDGLIPSLAGETLQGVLRITTNLASISVVGLRSHYNERLPQRDYLIATTPPTLENALPTSADRFFPQIANGDTFTTQVILFSGTFGQTGSGNLIFLQSGSGEPWSLDIH